MLFLNPCINDPANIRPLRIGALIMAIPFIDIKRFEPKFVEAWMSAVETHTRSAQFIGGESVAQLEATLSQYSGLHAVSCANGTDALQLAMRALGVGVGDRVLLPDLTFWATFEAIINVGAQPVLVDCTLADQAICPEKFKSALAQVKPKAAMIVNLYGWGSNHLAGIRELCAQEGVSLLEDSAQAFGVEYRGESIFKHAYIATTSFYPAKVLGAAGDGGAVFCADSSLAQKVRNLSNHGRSSHYGYSSVGWNSRMDSLQAVFVQMSLQHLPERLTSRRLSAQKYRQALSNMKGLEVVKAPHDYLENGYCNVCLVDDPQQKQKLETSLKANGIGFGNIYPSPMSAQEGAQPYMDKIARQFTGKNAPWVCDHVINLPLYAYMRDEEIDKVVSVVKEVWA